MTINGDPKLSRYEIRVKTGEDGMGDVSEKWKAALADGRENETLPPLQSR
jgi:hypothetical protein